MHTDSVIRSLVVVVASLGTGVSANSADIPVTAIAGANPSIVDPSGPREAAPATPRYARHHILVRTDDPAAEASFFAAAATAGLRRGKSIYGSRWSIVELPPGLDVQQALTIAAALPGAARVSRDPIITLMDHFVPRDPMYLDAGEFCDPLEGCYDQWGLFRVQAELGWHETLGSPDVVIAILDSGVDLDHDDLFANIWTNAGEVPDNGLDDDLNGIVDDVHGADFSGPLNDGGPQDEAGQLDGLPDVPEGGDWVEDPLTIFGIRFEGDVAVGDADDNDGNFYPDLGVFHGTAVAGIAAAMTDNRVPGSSSSYEGMAGACPRCSIMAVRMINAEGNAFASDAAAALRYAADMGADIINASWGLDPGLPGAASEIAVLEEAVDHALATGATIVAAAGNSGTPGLHYPAIDPRVVAVGSTNRAGEVSYFSTRANAAEVPGNGIDDDGNGWIDDVVDVVAPGEAIWSAWVLAAYDALLYQWEPGTDTYSVADGTSFATPLVAGYLGLVKSAHPSATRADVVNVLRTRANPAIGSSTGYDPESGFGELRMIVPASLTPANNSEPVADILGDQQGLIQFTDSGKSGVERVTLDGSGSYDADGFLVAYRWSWLDGDGVIRNGSGQTLSVDLSVGPSYYFTLVVEDDAGAVSAGDTVEVTVAAKSGGGGKGGGGSGGGGRGGGPKPR